MTDDATAGFPTCARCGKVHVAQLHGTAGKPGVVRACTGHKSSGPEKGRPCRRLPATDQDVCRYHGGASPQAKAAAVKRGIERKAAVAMRRFGEPVDTTPSEALLETVKWTAGYVAWLREKVASARTDRELVWGQTRAKIGGEDRGTTYSSGPNVWLTLLGEWQDRLVKVCQAAISAGIEERRVRLAEQQGALVADVIKAILNDLSLTAEQQAKVATVVPARLRGLTAVA